MFEVVSVKSVLFRNWVPFMVIMLGLSYVGSFMTIRSQMLKSARYCLLRLVS